MAKRTAYRDKETGRFVSKASWTRSKAQGGVRFVRERIIVQPGVRRAPEAREEGVREVPKPTARGEEFEQYEPDYYDEEDTEYAGAFDSPGKGKK